MRRAIDAKKAGTWTDTATGSVTLAFADRHRRRIRMTDDEGNPFLLDLANAVQLAHGDGLVLENGDIICVIAAPENVVDLTCPSAQDNLRLAWHIGNRHTPVQVLDSGALRIAFDHVLVDMAKGLGAEVAQKQAAFQPEGGAYDTTSTSSSSHQNQSPPHHDH